MINAENLAIFGKSLPKFPVFRLKEPKGYYLEKSIELCPDTAIM